MPARPKSPQQNDDFDNAFKGQIAVLDPYIIPSTEDPDRLVWDGEAYDFLEKDPQKDLANPSLWRQSRLCQAQGLFEVVKGVYQVRGFDLAHMTFIEIPNSDNVVIIDTLTSFGCAKAAIKFYQQNRGKKSIKALMYTHSHADHFGGAPAVLQEAGDGIPIYAPDGFLRNAVSETMYAGNAMTRRSVYMYGQALEKGPKGQIGNGLGLALSNGVSELVAPTHVVTHTGQKIKVGELEMIVQLTPGTEARSDMNIFFPQYRALHMAENATHTMHNIQSLRGAQVRDARTWSRYLEEALVHFGDDAEVLFASHHWPTFGKDNIREFLSQQRDLYAFLHNETLRQMNDGRTGSEIAERIQLPRPLQSLWSTQGYYGSLSHNVKGIYHRYMGWFDGKPSNLWEHPPTEKAKRYVDCMGGIKSVIDMGRKYREHNDLRFAATLLNHAVFADEKNKEARQELSAVFTELGYGAENGTWRNIYLTGAQELLGSPNPKQNAMSGRSLLACSLDQLFDTLAIRIKGLDAENEKFNIRFMVSDIRSSEAGKNQQGWHMNMSNGAVTGHSLQYRKSEETDLSEASLIIWCNHDELVELVTQKRKNLKGLKTSGKEELWGKITDLLTTPNPGFPIVTPN